MSDRSSLTSFMVSRNLKNAKNYFIEAKINKPTESVIPHQTLFQHQLGYAWPTIQHEKLFVTYITFIFETSPNTKPKEKKVGGTWHIMSPTSE